MPKARSFAAKLAHDISTEGKVLCPKLVRVRKSKADSWTPKYEFVSMCKCNEKDILAGKV